LPFNQPNCLGSILSPMYFINHSTTNFSIISLKNAVSDIILRSSSVAELLIFLLQKSPLDIFAKCRLTDHPPKLSCTLWKDIVLRIPKSTRPFRWMVWELSNSRSKSINFIEKNAKFSRGGNRDLKNSYFIFYKFNQGPVFCKHPNF